MKRGADLMRLLVTLAAIVVLSACGAADEPRQTDTANPATNEDTCVEVRAGIKSFNDRDYAGTIDHFKKAKALAKAYDEKSSARDAAELLEAVEYYAELPADDYPRSALSSKDFARYKAITLGQCMSEDEGTLT